MWCKQVESVGLFDVVDDDPVCQRGDDIAHGLLVGRVFKVGLHGLAVGEGEDDADVEGVVDDGALARHRRAGPDADDPGMAAKERDRSMIFRRAA